MMKLPLAIGLFSLLPMFAGASPVSSSPAAGTAGLTGAQHGLAFGGFFTLYSFAVAGPLPRAAAPALDLPPPADPVAGNPPAEVLTDDLDPVVDVSAPPTTRPVKPGAPAFVLAGPAADPSGRMPLEGMVDPVQPWGPVLVASASIEVPEPSTLLLAAIAVLALLATGGRRGAATGWRR